MTAPLSWEMLIFFFFFFFFFLALTRKTHWPDRKSLLTSSCRRCNFRDARNARLTYGQLSLLQWPLVRSRGCARHPDTSTVNVEFNSRQSGRRCIRGCWQRWPSATARERNSWNWAVSNRSVVGNLRIFYSTGFDSTRSIVVTDCW